MDSIFFFFTSIFIYSFFVGFQEGFQAGLEALGSQLSGFGQGGGWNMAQSQEDFGGDEDLEEEEEEEGYNMNMKETPGPCGWDYTGNKANINNRGGNMSGMGTGPMRGGQGSSGSYPHHLSNQPVTYPPSVTNPQGGQGFGGWNQGGGNWVGGGTYGWGQGGGGGGGGGGGRGGGNFQNFGEPAPKKWKPNQQQGNNFNFDYSSY